MKTCKLLREQVQLPQEAKSRTGAENAQIVNVLPSQWKQGHCH